MNFPRSFRSVASVFALAVAACSGVPDGESPATVDGSGDSLTSLTGVERPVQFQSYVYQPVSASDEAIAVAIAHQVKTALGALRSPQIGLRDRAASNATNPSKWTRETVTLIDTRSPAALPVPTLRVRYTYDDRAIVSRRYDRLSTAPLTLLFGWPQ